MVDFTNYTHQGVARDATAEYVMWQFTSAEGEHPVLTLRPATATNKPLHNAQLRRAQKGQRILRASVLSSDLVGEYRNEDRELYSRHVITGWENVVDSTGKPVPFNASNCRDFLRAIDDSWFDELRLFAENPVNFLEDEEDADDVEGLAGNSPGGSSGSSGTSGTASP